MYMYTYTYSIGHNLTIDFKDGSLDCNTFIQVRSQLSKNDRKKFNSVLIVDVHNRDIIDRFVRDR